MPARPDSSHPRTPVAYQSRSASASLVSGPLTADRRASRTSRNDLEGGFLGYERNSRRTNGSSKFCQTSGWLLGRGSLIGLPSKSLPRMKVFRSEEHTSELQSLMRISYAVFCLKKKNER